MSPITYPEPTDQLAAVERPDAQGAGATSDTRLGVASRRAVIVQAAELGPA